MDITVNHILYFITVIAILAYLLKINRAIYYFIMTSMTVVFYLVSGELTMSICIAGVITALIYVFLDRQPLKKRKSMLILEHMTDADKSKVLKIAKQLYHAKGTPASYKLLFRLLYNSDTQILMTGDLVFRASAGQWYVPKFLKVNGDASLWLTPGIKNFRVFGQTSKSFATIENVILNGSKCDVYISNIERVFQSGENIIVVDSRNQDIYVKDNEVVTKGTTGASTVTGKLVTRTCQFWEQFGNFATCQITYKGKRMMVFPDTKLED